MSDKNKDAPGELPDFPPLPTPAWARDHHGENEVYVAQDLRNFAVEYARAALARRASQVSAATPAAWIDQFGNVFPLGAYQPSGKPSYLDADKRGWKPLFRASEGQAQTSAAVELLRAFLSLDVMENDELTDDFDAWQLKVYEFISAQLADSTAPGVPVDRNAVLDELAAYHDQMQINTSGTRAAWVHGESARHVRSLKSSALTAQQSLKAGGAVPEGWVVEYDKYTSPGTIRMSSPKWGGCFLGKPTSSDTVLSALMYRYLADVLAAAPLMQVQPSEALDAARWRYVKATTTAIRDPETGEREECTPEQFEKSVDSLIADQQPVIPSVAQAVADSTGGVES